MLTLIPVFLFGLGAILLAFTRRKESLLLGFFIQWLSLAVELFIRGAGYSVIVTLFLGLFLSVASFVFQSGEAPRQNEHFSLVTFVFMSLSLLVTGSLIFCIGRPFFTSEAALETTNAFRQGGIIGSTGELLLDRYSLNLILFGLMLYVSCIASMGLRDIFIKRKGEDGRNNA